MTDSELTVLLAEKVMRWDIQSCAGGARVYAKDKTGMIRVLVDGTIRGRILHWHPTTEIADAWMVVKAMAERGYWCRVQSSWERGKPCSVGFTPHGVTGWNGRPDFEAQDDAVERATCLAALAWVASGAAGRTSL